MSEEVKAGRKSYRFWTGQELAYVRKHYPTQGAGPVGAALGRPAHSVSEFARRHGVTCLNQVGTYTLDAVRARCVIDLEDGQDACWHWTGRMHGGVPYGWHDGKLGSMRQVVYALHHGRPMPAGHVGRMTCGSADCLNPKHMKAQSRAALKAENQAKEPKALRSARLRQQRIATGTTALHGKALEIRLSDEPARVWAERLGVSEKAINQCRRGETWAPSIGGHGEFTTTV